jgi:hypothetical protein
MADSPELRDHIESALASGFDPDAKRAETIARENADMVRRSSDPKNVQTTHDFSPSDKLRATIRNAITAHRAKDAGHPAFQPTPKSESQAPVGPPATWSTEAKAAFKDLPLEVRLAALKEQKSIVDAVEPIGQIARRAAEIDRAIAPHRERIPAGMTEPAAVSTLFEWHRALSNPETQKQAFVMLGQQLGLIPADLQATPYQPQPVDNSVEQIEAQRIGAELAEFANGHEHFPKVRVAMAQLAMNNGGKYLNSDGVVNLEQLYRDACKAMSIDEVARAERAAVSPSSRSPAGPGAQQRSTGVRGAIRDAIRASRGQT